MNREIIEAIKQIEREKGIDSETLLIALEDALLAAYKKTPDASPHARIEIDRDTGAMSVFQLLIGEDDEVRTLPQPEYEIPEGVNPEDFEPPEPEIDWDAYADEEIEVIDVTSDKFFGRIAAQTAKQVIFQRIREAEREMMYDEYVDRVGDVVTGIVQQSDHRYTLVDLGRVEALLPESEQVHGERYDHGSRIKAVITEVRGSAKGPQVIVSRRADQLVRELFKLEVPEMADGLVEIRNVAREAGWRSKIAVVSHVQGVDPVGACVGPRGSRVRMVVSELRGEKIDIIPFNDEPARYIAKALSPARVREVLVDDDDKQATVIVPDDQLSLAIGREGMNARLAARLTGWRIDIKNESTFADEATENFDHDSAGGLARCAAVLRNGRRCPNAAEAGTRFCAIQAHAELAVLENDLGRAMTDEELAVAGTPEGVEAIRNGTPLPETDEPAEAPPEGGSEDAGDAAADGAELGETPADDAPEPAGEADEAGVASGSETEAEG
ncbi:MAG: transcription termination factor NusA [Thermoleophilia bacterium]